MTEIVDRPCKACGTRLRFVSGPNGKVIPLDTRAPTYAIVDGVAVRSDAMVSHFSTCPQAGRFSGSKR